MIIAQVPGVDQAIQAAANSGHWEAVTIVIILAFLLAFFGFVFKWLLDSTAKREERLALRISSLETFVEQTLVGLVKQCAASLASNIEAVNSLTVALDSRLCLMDPALQDDLIRRVTDKLADKVTDVVSDKVAAKVKGTG
jgi:type II secretory pathway component PulF